MQVHDLIRRRWSPRTFSPRPVPDESLALLLEAARWAPSSFNEQPWRFLITRSDTDANGKLLDCLSRSNRQWAATAPVLILMVASRTLARNGAPNHYALHDTGMALANLTMQATAMDLYVHPMAGYDRDKARLVFSISDDYEMGAAVAIGYLGDGAEPTPRTRKPIEELTLAVPRD